MPYAKIRRIRRWLTKDKNPKREEDPMPGGRPNPVAEPHMVIRVSIQGGKVVCDPDPARVKSDGTLQLVGDRPHSGFFQGESPFVNVQRWVTQPNQQNGRRHESPVFNIIQVDRQRAFTYELNVHDDQGRPIPVDPVVIVDL